MHGQRSNDLRQAANENAPPPPAIPVARPVARAVKMWPITKSLFTFDIFPPYTITKRVKSPKGVRATKNINLDTNNNTNNKMLQPVLSIVAPSLRGRAVVRRVPRCCARAVQPRCRAVPSCTAAVVAVQDLTAPLLV